NRQQCLFLLNSTKFLKTIMPLVRFWVFVLLLHCSWFANAQIKISMHYSNEAALHSTSEEQKKSLFPDTIYAQKNIDIITALQVQLNKLQEQGWLAFSYDTFYSLNDTIWHVEANVGQN